MHIERPGYVYENKSDRKMIYRQYVASFEASVYSVYTRAGNILDNCLTTNV